MSLANATALAQTLAVGETVERGEPELQEPANRTAEPMEQGGEPYGCPSHTIPHGCRGSFVAMRLPSHGGYLCGAACGKGRSCPAGPRGARAQPRCMLRARVDDAVRDHCGLACGSDVDCPHGSFCAAVGQVHVCACKHVEGSTSANETLAEQLLEGSDRRLGEVGHSAEAFV